MRGLTIFLVFSLPNAIWGQSIANLQSNRFVHFAHQFLQTDGHSYVAGSDLDEFIEKLDTRKEAYKKEVDFLRYLFSKTHNRFLKEYDDYSTFSELIYEGHYNCLTGTALYALLLERFDFYYTIVETNYHIFLLVQTGEQQVLFEATDPIHGFVSSEREINNRIAQYQNNSSMDDSRRGYHKFSFNLYNNVSLDQMAGLLYYNMSVDAYNQKEILESIRLLDKATTCYRSPRIEEFSSIILMTLMESDLEIDAKKAYVRKVQALML